MEKPIIPCTGGDWKIIPGSGLLTGADEINIANFNNHNIPAGEILGNLTLCGASKTMHRSIREASQQLAHYIETTPKQQGLSSEDQTHLFTSRLQYLLSRLQHPLPEALKSDYRTIPLTESLVNQFKTGYQALPEAEKGRVKKELVEYLLSSTAAKNSP